jgi:hypothetical protein
LLQLTCPRTSLPLHHNYTVPLVDQVRQFVTNDVLSTVPQKPANERLTAWWIGINDSGDVLGMNLNARYSTPPSPLTAHLTPRSQATALAAFWAKEMQAYFAAVVCSPLLSHAPFRTLTRPQESAYAAGLRGAYLFLNVPPSDLSPSNLGSAANMARANASVTSYNAALAGAVANFSVAHTDVHVSSFDAHTWFRATIANATALGFTNTTGCVFKP